MHSREGQGVLTGNNMEITEQDCAPAKSQLAACRAATAAESQPQKDVNFKYTRACRHLVRDSRFGRRHRHAHSSIRNGMTARKGVGAAHKANHNHPQCLVQHFI